MDFGPIVRYHRRAAGITQHELARSAGVGKTSVFDIEKGKAGVRLEPLAKVCRVLNITLCWESPLRERYEHSLKEEGDEKS